MATRVQGGNRLARDVRAGRFGLLESPGSLGWKGCLGVCVWVGGRGPPALIGGRGNADTEGVLG